MALLDVDLRGGGNGVVLARALFGRWGVPVIFASGQLAEEREARGVALGHIGKPYEVETVLRSLEVAREVMDGGTPQHLPLGFELFAAAG